MNAQSNSYRRCRAFIDANFMEPQPEHKRQRAAVTISRQAWTGSHAISEELIRLLEHDDHLGGESWALFDRDLVEKILEDHNLPKALARYMPEDRDRDFTGLINEIVGLHPSLWELFRHTCDTIRRLAAVGNVILIGRGAHIITRDMDHVLKVRIVGPFEERVRRAAADLKLPEGEAAKRVKQDDQARAAFVKSHFDQSLDDPMAYHLVINTGRVSQTAAARLIHGALRHR